MGTLSSGHSHQSRELSLCAGSKASRTGAFHCQQAVSCRELEKQKQTFKRHILTPGSALHDGWGPLQLRWASAASAEDHTVTERVSDWVLSRMMLCPY